MRAIIICECGREFSDFSDFNEHQEKVRPERHILMKVISLPMLSIGGDEIECPRWMAELTGEQRAKLSIDYKGKNYYGISKIHNIDGSYYLRAYYAGGW